MSIGTRIAIVLSASMSLFACVEPGERVGSTEDAVQGGEPDSGDPAVVAIYLENVVLCTATFISPRVVITAAHCLMPTTLAGHPVTDLEIRLGENVFFPDETLAVVDGGPHPNFTLQTMELDGNPDIGLLRVAEPVDIEPIALPTAEVSAALAKDVPLRVVGYGVTMNGAEDYGQKREADTAANLVSSYAISLLPASMCQGDSGGPYLYDDGGTETIVGAHSHGNCQVLASGSRVDSVLADFILPFVEEDCVADGYCLQACTNVVDPDCACAADGECNAACPAEVGDPDCPVCDTDGECNEACAEGEDADCDADPPPEEPEEDGCSSSGRDDSGRGWIALIAIVLAARLPRRKP